MINPIEQAVSQVPYPVTANPPSNLPLSERFAVHNPQDPATRPIRLLWSYDDVCSDLRVPRLIFNRAHRKGLIPRPVIRGFTTGTLFYDGHQFAWLKDFFGLLAETPAQGGSRQYTREALCRILRISGEDLARFTALDFAPRPTSSARHGQPVYSTGQLAWWVEFIDLQRRKAYDPTDDFVSTDEAHRWLGISSEEFSNLLDANPALKPVLGLRSRRGRVFHRESLTSMRHALLFGHSLAVA